MTNQPGRRGAYLQFRQLGTRWFDNDIYGHLNNTLHYQLFDTAVNAPLVEAGLLDPIAGETCFLVVESGCRYFAPLAFPQTITSGLRVAHLGRSSVRYEIALFGDDSDVAAAEGFFVHVNVRRGTTETVPIAPPVREFLEMIARE